MQKYTPDKLTAERASLAWGGEKFKVSEAQGSELLAGGMGREKGKNGGLKE